MTPDRNGTFRTGGKLLRGDRDEALREAEVELRAERFTSAEPLLKQLACFDRARRDQVMRLGWRLCAEDAAAAFLCVEAVADAAMASDEWVAAADVLHEFDRRAPHQVQAMMKLVEVCVDGGLESRMFDAQARLAEAYLRADRPNEARVISEDLAVREPGNATHIDRLRRALVMMGEGSPDRVIADRLTEAMAVAGTGDWNVFRADGERPPEAPAPVRESAPTAPSMAPPPVEHAGATSPALRGDSTGDADAFSEFRQEVSRQEADEVAAQQYKLALTYREMGMIDDAIKVLEGVVQSTTHRFDAGLLLGRLHRQRDSVKQAIEWFERAAESPASSVEEARVLLYELGDALEACGEAARSLTVLLELQADAGDYRDVRARVERLSRVLTGG